MKNSGSKGRTEKGVLAAITSSHLAQHFCVGFSVLYPDIMSDLGLNYTQLGIMSGANSIVSGFLQMLWSLLSRSFAKRVLLGFGNALTSIGLFVMGTSPRFMELVAGNVASGVGQSVQHPVGASMITQKFARGKVPWALSIHYGLGYVGNIVSPVLLSMIAVSFGWRLATYFLAVIPLMAGLFVLYYLKGEESASRSIRERERANLWDDVKSVIRIRGAMFIIAAESFAVGGTGMGVIITYAPLFLKRVLNVESLQMSVVYSIAVVGGVIGTLVVGRLAHRFGNLGIATPVIGVGSLLILLLAVYSSFHVVLVLHLFMIGAASFSCGSLLQAHLASISTPRQRDVLFGLYFTISHGISSVWTTLTGFLIDTYGSFNPAWVLRAILGTIAVLLLILARAHANNKGQTP